MNTVTTCNAAKEKFGEEILSIITCRGYYTIKVTQNSLKSLLLFLKDDQGYDTLLDLTATDYLSPPHTEVLYVLYHPINFEQLYVILDTDRLSAIPSIIDIWPGANWYEREVYDFFGLKFIGHPNLTRILMPDDWKGYPLLKDYALTEEPVEFKHGVKPKVPSEIIPHTPGKNVKIAD